MVAFLAALKLIRKAPNRSQSAMLILNPKPCYAIERLPGSFYHLTGLVQLHAALKRLGSLLPVEALHYNARKKLAVEKLAGSFALDLGFGAYNYGIIMAYKT